MLWMLRTDKRLSRREVIGLLAARRRAMKLLNHHHDAR